MSRVATYLPGPVERARAERLRSLRSHVRFSGALAAFLVVGLGGWATLTEIAGAVVVPGQVMVESSVKKVQHPTGGVVSEIRVREGSRVRAGDVLIRLDDTQIRANLEILRKAMDELAIRRARDEAERDELASFAPPADLLARRADPQVAALIDGEERLFRARFAARSGQKAQLRERIEQLRQEIAGLGQQIAAKDNEIRLIGRELTGVRELFAKNLVPLARVTALERDAARLEGERGQLRAATASANGKVSETELQVLQLDADMRTETSKDLAEIRGRWSELGERRVAAEDQLARTEMRAPGDGTVLKLAVTTVGGLVTPSEPAMLIVPTADDLVVEVRIQPQDIDGVRTGQTALLRFTAFNARTTPEIEGAVVRVSPDVVEDAKTGASHYTARVAVSEAQRARLADLRLQPGMPVEAHLQSGHRTVLSYLTRPLADQMAKAWRER